MNLYAFYKMDGISKKREFMGFVDGKNYQEQLMQASDFFPEDSIYAIEMPEKSAKRMISIANSQNAIFVAEEDEGLTAEQ